MEFLKALFEAGALTWEQFSEAVKKAGFEVVNAAGGAYVPKADLDAKQQELDTANTTIKDLRETAKAAQEAKAKAHAPRGRRRRR